MVTEAENLDNLFAMLGQAVANLDSGIAIEPHSLIHRVLIELAKLRVGGRIILGPGKPVEADKYPSVPIERAEITGPHAGPADTRVPRFHVIHPNNGAILAYCDERSTAEGIRDSLRALAAALKEEG